MAHGAWRMAHGDASELLELAEEALDEVALLVKNEVAGRLNFAISLGWNDDLGFVVPSFQQDG